MNILNKNNSIFGQSRAIAGLILVLLLLLQTGCTKFLDEKPEQSDIIPSTLEELQKLLNNDAMNVYSPAGLAELLADNYYVTTAAWTTQNNSPNLLNKAEAAHYIWQSDATPLLRTWRDTYINPIYYSNVVLDQLPIIGRKPGQEQKYDEIEGSALFYRAFYFFQLAQLYCKPYSTQNANELGIVLRTTSIVSTPSSRATVQETYDKIIADLEVAANQLPETTLFPTRPSKIAAHAALARVYLSMRDYVKAGQYADMALQKKNTLMNFNTTGSPFPLFNPEVIFHCSSPNGVFLVRARARTDTTLFNSYHTSDLRRTAFYANGTGANAGTKNFRGSYEGFSNERIFDGLATDELYLIRAECHARAGNLGPATDDLNALMINRWASASFTPFAPADANQALSMILAERRKELIFRGIRWSDIRRLNLENANIVLRRIINGTTYELQPNELKGIVLIPWEEVQRTGIEQNPR
jgi:starch-binding outer membrane protein, SusD/RagB family